MGLFDFDSPPSQVITAEEFRRIMSDWSMRHLPAKYKKRVTNLADAYIDEPGRQKGMDREEVEKFIKKVGEDLPDIYRGVVPELSELLEKALKGRFGGELGI